MKKLPIFLLPILLVATLISCNKDNPQYEEAKDAFLFDGVKYSTLQEAFNAAVALDEDDSTVEHNIQLMKNTSGPGASIPETFHETVILDLGQFCYEVEAGGSIDVCNANLLLTGNGGQLVAYGKTMPLLSANEGNISIERNANLESDGEVIRTKANVFVEKNFNGSIKGNVSVIQEDPEVENYNNFEYLSPNGTMDIGTLSLTGQRATFDVRAELNRAGDISIGTLQADGQNALRAIDKASVKLAKGGAVHVHEWTMSEHRPKTCYSEEEIEWQCTGCNEKYVEGILNDSQVQCPVASLVHYPAVEATEYEWGNIEFWECPFCGSLYADANAKTLLKASPFLEPLFETDDSNWEVEYCHSPKTKNPAAVLTVVANVATVISGITSASGSISRFMSESDKLQKLENIYSGIAEIQKQLGNLQENLRNGQERNANQKILYDRYVAVNKIYSGAKRYWETVDEIMKDPKLSLDAKLKEAARLAGKWHSETNGVSGNIVSLLQGFVGGEGQFSSIPVFAEKFQNNKQMWEHLGYGWRTDYQLIDLSKMIVCSEMELLYQELVNSVEYPAMAKKSIKDVTDGLDNCYKEYQRDSARMATRDAKYRVLVTGKYNQPYEISAKDVDIRGWFSKHRDRKLDFNLNLKDYPPKYAETIDQMIKDLDLADIMDEEAVKYICSSQRYKALGDAGFTNFKGSKKSNLLLLGKNSGDWCDLSYWFNRVIRSRYKLLYWENRTVVSGKDLVRIETVLSENQNSVTESLDIMTNAKFVCKKTKNNGTIKDMGTYSNKLPLKTIRKVKPEEKAEAIK